MMIVLKNLIEYGIQNLVFIFLVMFGFYAFILKFTLRLTKKLTNFLIGNSKEISDTLDSLSIFIGDERNSLETDLTDKQKDFLENGFEYIEKNMEENFNKILITKTKVSIINLIAFVTQAILTTYSLIKYAEKRNFTYIVYNVLLILVAMACYENFKFFNKTMKEFEEKANLLEHILYRKLKSFKNFQLIDLLIKSKEVDKNEDLYDIWKSVRK